MHLTGKKILIMTANTGVEKAELLKPLQQLREWGAEVTHAAIKPDAVQTFSHDTEKDEVVKPDTTIDKVTVADYDLLVIPGGTVNADKLRIEPAAIKCVQAFVNTGRPIAAICHGPWVLVESGVLQGKTLTSYKSLCTDILNAGAAEWKDQEVVRCKANGWILITSRNPNDLPAFNEAISKELTTAAVA